MQRWQSFSESINLASAIQSQTIRKRNTASCFTWDGHRDIWERLLSSDVQLSTYRNVCPANTWASRRTVRQATRRESSTPTSPKSYFISCWIQQIVAKRTRHFYSSKNKREFYISVELWSNNNCHTFRKLISSDWMQSIRTVMKLNTHTHTHTHKYKKALGIFFPLFETTKSSTELILLFERKQKK